MKKVLIIIRALTHGGAEKSLVSFLNTIDEQYLKENEIEIDLLMTRRDSFFSHQIPTYINVIECPSDYATFCNPIGELKNKAMMLYSLPRKIYSGVVKKTLGRKSKLTSGELQWKYVGKTLSRLPGKYDVAMAYFHDASTYYLMDKVTAKKKIIWIHNEYEKLGFTDAFERTMYERADKIVTISDRCVESFKLHFPDLSDKIEMIENISSSVIINGLSEEYEVPEYQEGQVNILSVGRLCHQKGYDLGLKAFHMLETKVKYHWFIMGAGEQEAELRNMILEFGLEDKVSLIGLRSNPYPYIGKCDIFFQPSRYEGKSIALDEAMILNRPIAANSYDTVTDSITDDVNGVLCGMEPEKIVDKLKRLIEDGDLRKSFSDQLKRERHGNEAEIRKYYELMS